MELHSKYHRAICDAPLIRARKWIMQGGVQGVGFRPFVYRLAHDYGLVGWVRNNSGQVEIVAQGRPDSLTAFADALVSKAPPLACPKIAVCIDVEPLTADVFSILESTASAPPDIHVPPDYFVCDDCLSELRNPADRRYRYPFINCTQCGPRYSIIKCLPYDRPNTTMADFRLCPHMAQPITGGLMRSGLMALR